MGKMLDKKNDNEHYIMTGTLNLRICLTIIILRTRNNLQVSDIIELFTSTAHCIGNTKDMYTHI